MFRFDTVKPSTVHSLSQIQSPSSFRARFWYCWWEFRIDRAQESSALFFWDFPHRLVSPTLRHKSKLYMRTEQQFEFEKFCENSLDARARLNTTHGTQTVLPQPKTYFQKTGTISSEHNLFSLILRWANSIAGICGFGCGCCHRHCRRCWAHSSCKTPHCSKFVIIRGFKFISAFSSSAVKYLKIIVELISHRLSLSLSRALCAYLYLRVYSLFAFLLRSL